MTIVCKNCDTRFNLPDGKIPPGGAKVRCSRCQHGFHIDPPGRTPGPAEDTGMAVSEEPSGSADDSDLENPEFLYEVEDEEGPESGEAVFGAGAQDSFDLGGLDDPEPESGGFEEEVPPEAPPAVAPEPAEERGSDEGPMDSWDPFEEDEETAPPAPAREPIPIRSGPELAAAEAVSPAVSEVAEKAASEARRGPRQRGQLGLLLATLVGAFLIAGGLHALKLYAIEHVPGPPTVRAPGWIATEIQAVHVRDAEGRRVLVVRGNLSSDGSTPTPKVRATLLDASGEPVGASVAGVLVRLEGAALAPEALARRLATRAATRVAGKASGFTVLLPDPPEEARRYRVELVL